jgi:flagellar biosynthesis protein FlhB
MIKKLLVVLIFLLIVSVAWVGFSLYYQSVELDVNPNAINYTKPISNTFSTETIDEVTERTEDSFPVSPQEFLKLNQLD